MGTRKCILVSSVLVIWLISGYSAHSLGSGRTAKILEEPIVPQASSYEVITHSDPKGTALQDPSDRSLSVENNMMLYRSVFTLSLKLLTVFVLVRLLTTGLTSAGILRPSRPVGGVPIVPFPGQPDQLYALDVNYNPGLALQGNVAGSTLVAGSGLSSLSTGAAAGASTGTAPLAVAPVPASGYIAAASNSPRPNYLAPGAPLPRPLPRFRFGFGPRHPPPRRPPHFYPSQQYNLGEETHYVDTHSHLLVMPDGSQARIPISQTAAAQQAKPATSNAQQGSSDQQDSKSSASSTDNTTERAPEESVNVSTSSSSSAASAERRSSNVFKERSSSTYLHQLQHQPYDDWTLHFSPGA